MKIVFTTLLLSAPFIQSCKTSKPAKSGSDSSLNEVSSRPIETKSFELQKGQYLVEVGQRSCTSLQMNIVRSDDAVEAKIIKLSEGAIIDQTNRALNCHAGGVDKGLTFVKLENPARIEATGALKIRKIERITEIAPIQKASGGTLNLKQGRHLVTATGFTSACGSKYSNMALRSVDGGILNISVGSQFFIPQGQCSQDLKNRSSLGVVDLRKGNQLKMAESTSSPLVSAFQLASAKKILHVETVFPDGDTPIGNEPSTGEENSTTPVISWPLNIMQSGDHPLAVYMNRAMKGATDIKLVTEVGAKLRFQDETTKAGIICENSEFLGATCEYSGPELVNSLTLTLKDEDMSQFLVMESYALSDQGKGVTDVKTGIVAAAAWDNSDPVIKKLHTTISVRQPSAGSRWHADRLDCYMSYNAQRYQYFGYSCEFKFAKRSSFGTN